MRQTQATNIPARVGLPKRDLPVDLGLNPAGPAGRAGLLKHRPDIQRRGDAIAAPSGCGRRLLAQTEPRFFLAYIRRQGQAVTPVFNLCQTGSALDQAGLAIPTGLSHFQDQLGLRGEVITQVSPQQSRLPLAGLPGRFVNRTEARLEASVKQPRLKTCARRQRQITCPKRLVLNDNDVWVEPGIGRWNRQPEKDQPGVDVQLVVKVPNQRLDTDNTVAALTVTGLDDKPF
jgi:hypothetical protein